MQNKRETNELHKQEKGKWEVRISATVFAEVRVLVEQGSYCVHKYEAETKKWCETFKKYGDVATIAPAMQLPSSEWSAFALYTGKIKWQNGFKV